MGKRKRRSRFSDDFRRDAVKLALRGEKTQAEIAAASVGPHRRLKITQVQCRRRPGRKRCEGRIVSAIAADELHSGSHRVAMSALRRQRTHHGMGRDALGPVSARAVTFFPKLGIAATPRVCAPTRGCAVPPSQR